MCTKQDQDRVKGIQPPVSHTLSDYHIFHGVRPLGHMSKIEVFLSSMNCMSVDSITEVFYHLNKMLIATEHIADGLSVRQHTGTSCVQHSPNLSTSLFLTYDPKSPDVIGEHH